MDDRRSAALVVTVRALRTATVVLLLGVIAIGASCASPSSSSSPSSIDCGESAGRNEEIEVAGSTAIVHLPPCYDATDGAYPTVHLLHGGGMSPASWVDPSIGADVVADRLMVDGEIEPVVLVFAPRAAAPSNFVDGVLLPLLDGVERDYRVLDSPDSRAIGGFSAAGSSTALSALSGSARFGAVGFFAVTWSDRVVGPITESMSERSDRPAIRIDIGDRDNLRSNSERLEADLVAIGLEPEMTIVPGGHNFEFVADRVDDWLMWFDAQRAR